MKSGLDGRIIPLKLLRLLEHLRSWNPQQKQIFHKFEPKKWFTKRAAISVCFSQAVPGTFLDALASGIRTIWKKTLVIGGLVGEVSSSIQWCDQEDHHNLRNLGKASFWRRLSTRRWAVSKVPTWGVIIARSVTFIVTTITTIITISHYYHHQLLFISRSGLPSWRAYQGWVPWAPQYRCKFCRSSKPPSPAS